MRLNVYLQEVGDNVLHFAPYNIFVCDYVQRHLSEGVFWIWNACRRCRNRNTARRKSPLFLFHTLTQPNRLRSKPLACITVLDQSRLLRQELKTVLFGTRMRLSQWVSLLLTSNETCRIYISFQTRNRLISQHMWQIILRRGCARNLTLGVPQCGRKWKPRSTILPISKTLKYQSMLAKINSKSLSN